MHWGRLESLLANDSLPLGFTASYFGTGAATRSISPSGSLEPATKLMSKLKVVVGLATRLPARRLPVKTPLARRPPAASSASSYAPDYSIIGAVATVPAPVVVVRLRTACVNC